FNGNLTGVIRRGQASDGSGVVDLRMRVTGGPAALLRIRLGGQTLSGGGLLMKRSAVTFGPPSATRRYRGRVESLRDTTLRALVGTSRGRAVNLDIELSLQGSSVTGALRGTPVNG